MPNASDYVLRVTAGPEYDVSKHHLIAVNTGKPTKVKSSRIDADVSMFIQNYHGLPHESPTTHEYFSQHPHEHDLYSVTFKFRLNEDLSGNEVYWGNDFDEPIRNNLPPGINTALRIVRWGIDPGLNGDVYADHPYLYGPLLSSINTLRVCAKEGEGGSTEAKSDDEDEDDDDEDDDEDSKEGFNVVKEGGSGTGKRLRKEHKLPSDSAARMKHFLTEANRQHFTFEKGREYSCDFFNPYLDFNEFALKLPGFSLSIMRFWDGQPLRYTLKHRTPDASTDEVLLAITIALIHNDKVEEEAKKWGEDSETAKQAGEYAKANSEVRRKSLGEAAAAAEAAGKSAGSAVAGGSGEYEDEGVD